MQAQPSRIELTPDAVEAAATFEAFFAAERDGLFRALLLLTGSKQEAEDLTQGTFLKLLERWDRLGQDRDLKGYLFRTALNSYRSLYRRSRIAARRALARSEIGIDPFELVAERDTAVRLLLGLTRRQREAIVLTGIEGFDYRHAGELLGIKEPTVRSLVSQARARFAKEMETHDE
jgi:RNA polymerase sigma-70 factor (ECF subfamily)